MKDSENIHEKIEEADKNYQSYIRVGDQVIFIPTDDSKDITFQFRYKDFAVNSGASVKVLLQELTAYHKETYIPISEFMINKDRKRHSEPDQDKV